MADLVHDLTIQISDAELSALRRQGFWERSWELPLSQRVEEAALLLPRQIGVGDMVTPIGDRSSYFPAEVLAIRPKVDEGNELFAYLLDGHGDALSWLLSDLEVV